MGKAKQTLLPLLLFKMYTEKSKFNRAFPHSKDDNLCLYRNNSCLKDKRLLKNPQTYLQIKKVLQDLKVDELNFIAELR